MPAKKKPTKAKRKKLRPCGTYAAARRHQRRNEPMCAPCLACIAARQRDFYHRRKQRAAT